MDFPLQEGNTRPAAELYLVTWTRNATLSNLYKLRGTFSFPDRSPRLPASYRRVCHSLFASVCLNIAYAKRSASPTFQSRIALSSNAGSSRAFTHRKRISRRMFAKQRRNTVSSSSRRENIFRLAFRSRLRFGASGRRISSSRITFDLFIN